MSANLLKLPKKTIIELGEEDLINSHTPPVRQEARATNFIQQPDVEDDFDEKEIIKNMEVFSTSSNMLQAKKNLLFNRKLKKFERKIKPVLLNLKHANETKNKDFFLFVLQSIGDYIQTDEPEKQKLIDNCAQRLLQSVVNCDDTIFNDIVEMVQPLLKKSTIWRRNKKRCTKMMTFFLSHLLKPR